MIRPADELLAACELCPVPSLVNPTYPVAEFRAAPVET
jgi:hypothetical protein